MNGSGYHLLVLCILSLLSPLLRELEQPAQGRTANEWPQVVQAIEHHKTSLKDLAVMWADCTAPPSWKEFKGVLIADVISQGSLMHIIRIGVSLFIQRDTLSWHLFILRLIVAYGMDTGT